MDYQKFTEKSLSAISAAEQTAREYGNPEIKQEHLLYALLVQDNGLIPEVLKSVNVDADKMAADVKRQIEKLAKVRGQSATYVSAELASALDEAEKQADSMNDDFVSVEHIMLGVIVRSSDVVSSILNGYSVIKVVFLFSKLHVRFGFFQLFL